MTYRHIEADMSNQEENGFVITYGGTMISVIDAESADFEEKLGKEILSFLNEREKKLNEKKL